MSQAALALEESNSRQLLVELATDARSLRAAQALRYQVFAEECGAVLHTAEAGLDQDHYDLHCEHLIVRDQNTGRVVATTRILDSRRAPEAGGFYSESEFQLVGLTDLRGDIMEIGRTCVHSEYRNGATISALWSGLAQLMNERHYAYLMGCASIDMRDDGLQEHSKPICAWERRSAVSPAGIRSSTSPMFLSCYAVSSFAHATLAISRQSEDDAG